jgi:hypothetical protein
MSPPEPAFPETHKMILMRLKKITGFNKEEARVTISTEDYDHIYFEVPME